MKKAPAKKKAAAKKTVARKARRSSDDAAYYGTPEFAEKLTAHFFAAKRFALGYAK